MSPVKWGIISTAKIGTEKVIPGMLKSKHLEVVAIASRDLKTAKAAAKKLGIPKAYGSYEELLADPEIEAVYNPLPNHLHVPLTLKAAAAGKHVLCEKPIAITAKEAQKLKKVKRGMHVAEAFMVRHNPQWIEVKERVKKGEIGTVRAIQVFFTYYLDDPSNIRNMAKIGGGGMLDIGCYPITVARFVFDAEPKRVIALIDRDPKFKTDRHRQRHCRFRQWKATDLHRLDADRTLSARPYWRHERPHRGRNPVQRTPRRAQPAIHPGHGNEQGPVARIAGERPVPDAGGSLRPRHPQTG